jgi:cell division protein FtsA
MRISVKRGRAVGGQVMERPAMTQDSNVLAAIDVGTSKVCTIIASRSNGRGLRVLGHSVVPSGGLEKGNVADVPAAEKTIRKSVEAAERVAGVRVRSAFVGVAGSHVSFENRWDSMDGAGRHGVITADDVERAPQVAAAIAAKSGRRVIHAIPRAFSVDGKRGIRHPLGMHSRRLDVETHVVKGDSRFMDKLVAAVESAGVKVESLVLEPLASSQAVLTNAEKEQGVVLVDIGGGTADIVVFRNGQIDYTAVTPVAGYQFTNDICATYNTPYEAAEEAKLKFAHTEPYGDEAEGELTLPIVGRTAKLKVQRRELCQLTRERAQELARLIRIKLLEANMGELGNLPVVLTGGTAKLPGLKGLMQGKVSSRVRVGVPNGHVDVPEELRAPAYATSVGLLLWAAGHAGPVSSDNGKSEAGNGSGSLVSRLFNQIQAAIGRHRVIGRITKGRVEQS